MVDLLGFLLIIAALGIPGFGVTLAIAGPGGLPLMSRLALALPLGFCLVGVASLVLSLIGELTPLTIGAAYLGTTAAIWAGAALLHPLGEYLREWRIEIRNARWVYATLGVLTLAFAVVRFTYGPEGAVAPTALRYWADGLEIADSQAIPELSLHWAHLLPPTVSKVVLNCFHASASFVLGRDPLHAVSVLLTVVAVGLIIVAFALARELGLRASAGVVALLLFGNQLIGGDDLTRDLNHYHAENWGRLIVLGAVLIAVRAIRSEVRLLELSSSTPPDAPLRSVRSLEHHGAARGVIVSGVMFGVASGTHLVPFAVGLLFLLCYGFGLVVTHPWMRRPFRLGISLLASAALVAPLVLFLPRGDIGFQGARGQDEYAPVLSALQLPTSFDPTLYLATGELDQPVHVPAGAFYDPPAEEYGWFVGAMLGLPVVAPARGVALAAGVVLVALVLLILVFGSRTLRALAIGGALFGVGLLVTGALFLYRYDLYALAHFGKRRLFDYAAVPLILIGGCALEAGIEIVQRHSDRVRRMGSAALGAVLTVLVGLIVLPSAVAHEGIRDDGTLRVMAWVREHVPCEGRILADRRTLASFETLTGRAAVLEGMGPHVRPDVLRIAVGEMLSAHEFLLHPALNESYLQARGVAAVIVTERSQRLGGWHKVAYPVGFREEDVPPADVDPASITPSMVEVSAPLEQLLESPFLRLASWTSDAAIFEVVGFDPAAGRGAGRPHPARVSLHVAALTGRVMPGYGAGNAFEHTFDIILIRSSRCAFLLLTEGGCLLARAARGPCGGARHVGRGSDRPGRPVRRHTLRCRVPARRGAPDPRRFGDPHGSRERPPGSLVLLAADDVGYANLCRLLTDAHMTGERGAPALAGVQICAHAHGLVALAGPRSIAGRLAIGGRLDAARRLLEPFREAFGRDRLFVAVEHRLERDSDAEVRALLRLADVAEIRATATNPVRYLVEEDAFLADVLECMREIVPLATHHVSRRNAEGWLKPAAAMHALFEERPDLCATTLDIAEMCRFDLGLRRLHFPEFPTPQGRSADAVLAERCWRGMRERGVRDGPAAADRLRARAVVDPADGVCELLPHRRRYRRGHPLDGDPLRVPGLGGGVLRLLSAPDLRRRRPAARSRVRAVLESLARRVARHRHRCGVCAARGRVRHGVGAPRRGPNRVRGDDRHVPRTIGVARGRQDARPARGRGRHDRESVPAHLRSEPVARDRRTA